MVNVAEKIFEFAGPVADQVRLNTAAERPAEAGQAVVKRRDHWVAGIIKTGH